MQFKTLSLSLLSLSHPTESLYYGALPVSLLSLANILAAEAYPSWGPWAAYLAWALWMHASALAVVVAIGVPLAHFLPPSAPSLSLSSSLFLSPPSPLARLSHLVATSPPRRASSPTSSRVFSTSPRVFYLGLDPSPSLEIRPILTRTSFDTALLHTALLGQVFEGRKRREGTKGGREWREWMEWVGMV